MCTRLSDKVICHENKKEENLVFSVDETGNLGYNDSIVHKIRL